MKTNIILRVSGDYTIDRCRVKLDKNKFPYIVVRNEKIVINSVEFPRTVEFDYGASHISVDIIEGRDELKSILANSELTVDKLSLKQRFRIG